MLVDAFKDANNRGTQPQLDSEGKLPVAATLVGEYNSTPPTVADGETVAFQVDENGNLLVSEAVLRPGEDPDADVRKFEMRGTPSYQATAGDNKVIKAAPGFLYGILIGKNVASSVIEISDHASDGDGNVKVHLEGDTLLTSTGGYVPLNMNMPTGICADLDNQTNVTFFYR